MNHFKLILFSLLLVIGVGFGGGSFGCIIGSIIQGYIPKICIGMFFGVIVTSYILTYFIN